MPRPALEVADIFRASGPAWREAHAGHLSLGQLKVMSAIERCRSAALGGHVTRCQACAHTEIAYNSCRNRHCPKCQGAAARQWLAERQAELLPVAYFHVVFTVPGAIANSRLIAFDGDRVTFRWKDYRAKEHNRYKTMSLATEEFIRRFLIHVLPRGFHRIRHYGLFANARREMNLLQARQLLEVHAEPDHTDADHDATLPLWLRCRACGGAMRVIDTFAPRYAPWPPPHRGRDPP